MWMRDVCTGFALVAMWAGESAGQDVWAREVRTQLIDAAVAAGYRGFELSHEPGTGRLNRGGYGDTRVELDEGTTYVIVGACDRDCLDLDLRLYDSDGNTVDEDIAEDDRPVIAVTPAYTDAFLVRVIMAHCAKSPCRYGFGVFQRE